MTNQRLSPPETRFKRRELSLLIALLESFEKELQEEMSEELSEGARSTTAVLGSARRIRDAL